MSLSEQIARCLAGELPGLSVTHGFLPQAPDRCAAVFATDLRVPGGTDGARIQVRVRGGRDARCAIADAERIAELLGDFTGLFTPDGDYIVRAILESGPAHIGADQNNRQEYSLNFRVWYC